MFSHDLRQVVLIRKNKPVWQSGKLNGIGGKLEENEVGLIAMKREFKEETGVETSVNQWRHYCSLRGSEFCVECFCTMGDVDHCKTMESEEVAPFYLSEVPSHRTDMIENIGWLMSLAIDRLTDGRPSFVIAQYP